MGNEKKYLQRIFYLKYSTQNLAQKTARLMINIQRFYNVSTIIAKAKLKQHLVQHQNYKVHKIIFNKGFVMLHRELQNKMRKK